MPGAGLTSRAGSYSGLSPYGSTPTAAQQRTTATLGQQFTGRADDPTFQQQTDQRQHDAAQSTWDSFSAADQPNYEVRRSDAGVWGAMRRSGLPASTGATTATAPGGATQSAGSGAGGSSGAAPDMPTATNASAMAGLQAAGGGYGSPDTANFLHSDASNGAPGQPLSQTGASGAMDGLQALLTRSRLY